MANRGTLELVEGWTEPIDFVVLDDGVPVDLTGYTAEFRLETTGGSFKSLSGTTSLQDAENGVVRFSPDAADFVASESPYDARIKLTSGSSKVSWYPAAVDGLEVVVVAE